MPAASTVPPDAQQVEVTATDTEVLLDPSTVHAGDVYFVFEPDPVTQHVELVFVHGGGPDDPAPEPLTDDDVATLERDSAPEGLSQQIGFPAVQMMTLAEGRYVFMLPGADGAQPGDPPVAMTVLEVTSAEDEP